MFEFVTCRGTVNVTSGVQLAYGLLEFVVAAPLWPHALVCSGHCVCSRHLLRSTAFLCTNDWCVRRGPVLVNCTTVEVRHDKAVQVKSVAHPSGTNNASGDRTKKNRRDKTGKCIKLAETTGTSHDVWEGGVLSPSPFHTSSEITTTTSTDLRDFVMLGDIFPG